MGMSWNLITLRRFDGIFDDIAGHAHDKREFGSEKIYYERRYEWK